MSEPVDATLRDLAWDSDRFGIRVGELTVGRASAAAVRSALDGRARDFDLIYVRDANADVMSSELLSAWSGQHTDSRATFELAPLAILNAPRVGVAGKVRSGSPEDMSDDIAGLAFQAAAHWRFRNDERFREQWVRDMYRSWIEQALSREGAGDVLLFEQEAKILGLYTLQVKDDAGNLDLFAVDESVRGQGVGAALMVAAIEWMRDHSLVRATVTTQLDNPACRLYRRMGYRLAHTEEIYHLWPNAGSSS